MTLLNERDKTIFWPINTGSKLKKQAQKYREEDDEVGQEHETEQDDEDVRNGEQGEIILSNESHSLSVETGTGAEDCARASGLNEFKDPLQLFEKRDRDINRCDDTLQSDPPALQLVKQASPH